MFPVRERVNAIIKNPNCCYFSSSKVYLSSFSLRSEILTSSRKVRLQSNGASKNKDKAGFPLRKFYAGRKIFERKQKKKLT